MSSSTTQSVDTSKTTLPADPFPDIHASEFNCVSYTPEHVCHCYTCAKRLDGEHQDLIKNNVMLQSIIAKYQERSGISLEEIAAQVQPID